MKKFLSIFLVVILTVSLIACTQEGPSGGDNTKTDTLVLYTSAGASEYEFIVSLFNEKYPEINVEIVSAGTGELASRITAEKENPYGDVLMGGGATSYLGIADMLEPYASENKSKLYCIYAAQ